MSPALPRLVIRQIRDSSKRALCGHDRHRASDGNNWGDGLCGYIPWDGNPYGDECGCHGRFLRAARDAWIGTFDFWRNRVSRSSPRGLS